MFLCRNYYFNVRYDFFLPELTNHRRQKFCQHDLPWTKTPASANMTPHEQNHWFSFFAHIPVFFIWLSCVCASPCCVVCSIPAALLTAFCSCSSPCHVACSTCFPLLLAVFSFARIPLSNNERLNRGYNPCLRMWCRCECSRGQPGKGQWWNSWWRRRNVNVLGCVLCVCV